MKLTILYGSATGNAEHIAKDLAASINESRLALPSASAFSSAVVMELNHFKRKKLMESWVKPATDNGESGRHALIVVCSTTGNADAPENASRFVRYIRKPPPAALVASSSGVDPARPLAHLAYAVLGLGDTNYDQFCASGKVIDRKLAEWGAIRAVELACADEATGLEATVEPWLENVLVGLERACKGGGDDDGKDPEGAADAALGGELDKMLKVSNNDGSKPANAKARDKPDVPQSTLTAKSSDQNNATGPMDAEGRSQTTGPAKSPTPLYILYGSATGNAEHIAKDLCSTYEMYLQNPSFLGYFPSVVCCPLNQYKKKCLDQWTERPHEDGAVKHGVIVVCSTTGNADAPENSDRFVRWMKRKSTEPARPFQHCAYAVLGLGDSNYDVFCATGKAIDKRLAELGGTRAIAGAWADEATGLEETVEPWVGSVIGRLADVCGGGPPANGTARTGAAKIVESGDATQPVSADPPPSSVQGKKMDLDENDVASATDPAARSFPPCGAAGVSIVRKLLSLPADSPLPNVSNASCPAMASSLSSCELITDETRESRGDSTADNATVSSASSGFLYTASRPYESAILHARYLTATSKECSKEVAELFKPHFGGGPLAGLDSNAFAGVNDAYERHFPLQGRNGGKERQYEKNGKRVIEMTLGLPDDFTLDYEPGDSVGLIVPNTPQSTQFILSMLERKHGILPSQKISIDAAHPITVEEAIGSNIDLCSTMKRKVLFRLSKYAADPEEERALRLLCSDEGTDKGGDLFKRYVEDQRRTVVDILEEFPSCQSISLEGLLGCLPSVAPRYYSVCSSPLHDRQQNDAHFQLKVAFSVVDYVTPHSSDDDNSGRRIGGLATQQLERACSPYLGEAKISSYRPTVQIFPKATHEFRLPSDMSTPMILIGPGTGIAPFIGFLSHRGAQLASLNSTEAAEMTSEGTWRGGYELDPNELALSRGDAQGLNPAVDYARKYQTVGDIDLFFGCRHEDHDFLYRGELEEFRASGILTNLYTAFSRDGEEKAYVQMLMQNGTSCGKRLVQMIMERNASVFICGDGNAMGRDVQDAIAALLAKNFVENGACNNAEEGELKARAHIDQMKTSGRFVLDIWS